MTVPQSALVDAVPGAVTLDDKYALARGHVFMSGIQALVRLPMLQQQRDALQGKSTAGMVSGYRGSPLGGYDLALWKAKQHLDAHQIVFQSGVNEELAATALWGTQMLGYAPPGTQKFDGVFGLWYGKGPGVDRCSDVFKHANLAGTTPWGGVIAVAGDDHAAKSSSAPHQSDHVFKACGLPVFFPSSVQEILDLGIHAFAMSRYAGLWAGMKTIQEVVESGAGVEVDPQRVQIVLPDFPMPAGGLHIRWPDTPLAQEDRLMNHKWYAALAYVRANRLNHDVWSSPDDRYGIIASGKAYSDTRQALADLGLDQAACRALGIRLHKVAVVWPLEAQTVREFATGLQEILVVEEKRQVIEYQLKEELYNWRPDVRPDVLGKFDESGTDHSGGEWSLPDPSGQTLLRATADLTPALIARAIGRRLQRRGLLAPGSAVAQRVQSQLDLLDARAQSLQTLYAGGAAPERPPWYCSGCPHNRSTVVPEGSRAIAGIGCHYMVTWMDRHTEGFTQMGGEGVPWVGQQPFSREPHLFANLGDGTYFHSGLLAIRQTIAAGVNITYKILYNDAVAMTGGQPVGERPEGCSVLQIVHSLRAEGVRRIVIVTDEPLKYVNAEQQLPGGITLRLPAEVPVEHRDELDRLQREFREVAGTTAIIYDQTCATEKRRRRKRGLLVEPARRVFINAAVCEGCGDCGEKSNCLSVEPLETELGRKRQINQSSCNLDYSCLDGFCPSFVTVEGGRLRRAATKGLPDPAELGDLPEPELPATAHPYGILIAGVGGTGVITLGQLIGEAAFLDGRGVVTQDAAGLAQKGGATWSHVQIAERQPDILTTRVSLAEADLLLGCDPIVAAQAESVSRLRAGRSRVALNSHVAPTAAFVHQGGWKSPGAQCQSILGQTVGEPALSVLDAEALARQLVGDAIYANPLLLGYAWQRGWVPVRRESLQRAIELNATAVAQNLAAFEWGRLAAHDGARVQALLTPPAQVIRFQPRPGLDSLLRDRVARLTAYQDAAYARRYQEAVRRVQQAEAARVPGKSALAEAVARHLHDLMAYKDEYEVARLYTDGSFEREVAERFEGDYQLHFHLAPPFWAKRDPQGELRKNAYGPWMLGLMRGLARLKFLRGTAFDPFGRSAERHTERALPAEYLALVDELLATLTPDNHALALQLAHLPGQIKGFGHVKARHLAAARERWSQLLAQWRAQSPAGDRA
ncbi:indolepyruvate ferredoxin oxidoreductase family protein [Malikia spinosa]|uniref:indolepyruvate ferredoxin oxidoreductase family protein n=1 Tax=Malikia spinosa TaxID=86180 RepID=UPI0027B9536F|nr:indolepyruvate ferredoxin oxidoreductase family protein [Malikia spinosa]